MKIEKIKSILFLLVTVTLALAFPMQVMMSSPIPALGPYLGVVLIFSLTLFQQSDARLLRWNVRKPIVLLVSIYIFIVLFQTGWQAVLGFISIENAVSALVVFLLPILFFVYFRSVATDQDIRSVLYAISLVGLIVGTYFAYDSYSMLVLGELNDFSLSAFEYSQARVESSDHNIARISIGYRSHGLLESHSISAAWIALGCFSALTLLPKNQSIKRGIVILLYGAMLLIGLNFTAIIGFAFVIILMEYKAYTLLRGVISRSTTLLLPLIIGAFIAFISIQLVLPGSMGEDMLEVIKKSLIEQVDLAGGKIELGNTTYFGGLVSKLISFPYNMLKFPPGVLIGDGFSTFGIIKGGDYGIVETLHRFGLPFFLVIIVGMIRLIRRAIKKLEHLSPGQSVTACYIWFATSATIYVLFTEVHYSIWSTKSILPILFISLAIFDRYLYSPAQYAIRYKQST